MTQTALTGRKLVNAIKTIYGCFEVAARHALEVSYFFSSTIGLKLNIAMSLTFLECKNLFVNTLFLIIIQSNVVFLNLSTFIIFGSD